MTKWRIYFICVIFFVGFSLVLFRTFQLQILPQANVKSLAKKQLYKNVETTGRRGTIYDRNGRELAVSINTTSVFVNPQEIKNVKEVSSYLSRFLDLSAAEIQHLILKNKQKKFVWIKRQIQKEELVNLEKADFKKFPGVGVLPEYRREYPFHELASHVLGFISVDGMGLEGIERKYNELLKAPYSIVTLNKDALGRPIYSQKDQVSTDQEGKDVNLTVDINIQYAAQKYLKEAVEKHEALSGSVVVVDPTNFEIVALANEPSFDPNKPSDYTSFQRRNRAFTDPFEPGSTVKALVVAKALEEKIVGAQTKISGGDGFIKIGRKTIGESDEKHRYKELTVADIVKVSSNVGTVNLMKMMGFENVWDVFTDVGFGSQVLDNSIGETKGIFVKPSKKQFLEQATMSFGQGFSTTPLQIAAAFSVLAGDGRFQKLSIVKNENEKKFHTVFKQKTLDKVRKILTDVVSDEGTGFLAKIEGFDVAGKTGTAQKPRKDGKGYEKGAYISSFVGMVPANQPKYVVYVSVDHPKKNGYYGGVVAAPVFAKVAREALRSQKKENFVAENIKIEKKQKTNIEVMPEFIGQSLPQAMRALSLKDYKVEIEGQGTFITDQIPEPGKNLDGVEKIYFRLR